MIAGFGNENAVSDSRKQYVRHFWLSEYKQAANTRYLFISSVDSASPYNTDRQRIFTKRFFIHRFYFSKCKLLM